MGKRTITKTMGSLLHILGWLFIFGFTGTCTVLLFRQYAPVSTPWLPWAGLAAFEFGLVHWLHYHQHVASNVWQFIVSLIMSGISAIAIALATGTEMLSWFSASGDISLASWLQGAIFYAIIGVIVANVIAFMLCRLLSPEHFLIWKQLDQMPPEQRLISEPIIDAEAETIDASPRTRLLTQDEMKATLRQLFSSFLDDADGEQTMPHPAKKKKEG
jgi:hypothetical protein